jgi:hypothetical protein
MSSGLRPRRSTREELFEELMTRAMPSRRLGRNEAALVCPWGFRKVRFAKAAPSLGSDPRLTAIRVLIGALLAVGMARLIAGLLFGVKPADPLTYILAPAGLITVALAAGCRQNLREAVNDRFRISSSIKLLTESRAVA